MVPIRTNEVCAASRARKRAISPIDSTPTTGKNRSSKKKNTLREAMSRLRIAKAHTATSSARVRPAGPGAAGAGSARELNEHFLELWLGDPHVADAHPLGHDRP